MAFVDEQTEAGASGLRALKDAGDPQWCWQTISYLQTIWQSLSLDYDRYMQAWEEAEEHKVWEKVPYDNPFGTKEEMLSQLELGDDKHAQRRMNVQPIARRIRLKFSYGGDRRSEGFQDYNCNVEAPRQGNSREYLLSRLYHKHYDIFQRWERGEFRSVRAAAIAAGIGVQQAKRSVTLGNNMNRLAEVLHTHYTPDQLAALSDRMLQLRKQAGLE